LSGPTIEKKEEENGEENSGAAFFKSCRICCCFTYLTISFWIDAALRKFWNDFI
jgi:hypothetical protein